MRSVMLRTLIDGCAWARWKLRRRSVCPRRLKNDTLVLVARLAMRRCGVRAWVMDAIDHCRYTVRVVDYCTLLYCTKRLTRVVVRRLLYDDDSVHVHVPVHHLSAFHRSATPTVKRRRRVSSLSSSLSPSGAAWREADAGTLCPRRCNTTKTRGRRGRKCQSRRTLDAATTVERHLRPRRSSPVRW